MRRMMQSHGVSEVTMESTAPCTEKNPKFMVFKLNDKDAEASVYGDAEIAPQPQGFPFGGGFGGAGGGARPNAAGAPARR